jgi:hypothetical protein
MADEQLLLPSLVVDMLPKSQSVLCSNALWFRKAFNAHHRGYGRNCSSTCNGRCLHIISSMLKILNILWFETHRSF